MRGPTDQRHRGILVALGVAVLLLAAGAVVVRTGSSGPTPGGAAPEAGRGDGATHESAQPGQRPVDPPDPPSPDEAGAVTAAVSYAAMPQRWLYLADDEVLTSVADIATPGSADQIARAVLEEVRSARDQLAQSPNAVWWLVRPLASKVERYGDDHATVAVWTVSVLSAPEVAAPQSEWATVTMDLAWLDGAWRLEAVRDRPGPTPAIGAHDDPWDARSFGGQLEGFTRLAAAGEPIG